MTTLGLTTSSGELHVGIGQLHVSSDSRAVLIARGLGSCVGLAAFDPVVRVGGLLHIILPAPAGGDEADDNPLRYAESGAAAMFEALLKRGAAAKRLMVKAAGGASIVRVPGFSDRFRIGERNIEAVRGALRRWRIELAAEDLGGTLGRTIRLNIADGSVWVQSVGHPPRAL